MKRFYDKLIQLLCFDCKIEDLIKQEQAKKDPYRNQNDQIHDYMWY